MTRDERGWRETRHLLSNPRNAARLLASIRDADAGVLADFRLDGPRSLLADELSQAPISPRLCKR